MMSFKKINLNCLIIIGLFVLNLSFSQALKRAKRGYFQCSNIVVNSNFVEHTILYKDNVNTVSECCEFCNSNLACTVWTLQLDIGRCLLKSQKGARVVDAGFISGFSDRYASTLSTPIPHTTTTTPSTTITPLTQTSTLTLTSETKNPITKCEVLSGFSFGKSAMNQASNVSLTICCDFCAEFNICKSYTYFMGNKTCLLFDEINLTPIKCADQDQCESGRIFMDFQSTPLPTLSPTTSQEYIQVYSFYSMFDRFQLKFSNLINDYFFLNNLPLTEPNQIEFLKNTIHHLEYSIKENVGVFLQNRIKRVIIDNMAYLPSTRSIVVSFIVIMEPDLQDINEGNGYLSIFNSLIANRIGFGNIKFYNESLSNSDLLPSVSQFSLKFVNINDISLLSFERIAISPFTSNKTTTKTTSVTSISQTTTPSTSTSSSTISSSTTTITLSTTRPSFSSFTSRTSTTITTTLITTPTTTTSTTTTTTSTTATTTSTTTTTTSTSPTTTSTTTTSTSTPTTTFTSTTTTTTSTTTTSTSTPTTTSSSTTTTATSTTSTSYTSFNPISNDSLASTVPGTSTKENTIFTSFSLTTMSTENQTTYIDDNLTTPFFETTSTQFYTSQFGSLVDLSTQLSELDQCWIELNTLYIGENLGEYIIASIDECCTACQLNSECQSWVYHNFDQTCQLKKSLRSTYFVTNEYTSGFLKRPYDTFIKVSNSLGLTNSNQTIFDNIKENVFNLWFKYLFSNIKRISDSYESEEFIYDNKMIQAVTYLLQLDPRISQNSQILMKLVNKVNSTLSADPDFYNPVVANLTTDNEIVAYVLPSTQISVIEIFQNQSHVTNEETIASSIPTRYMTTADQTSQTSTQQSQTDTTSLSSLTPLTTSFGIAAYQSGNCFIESNVNYVSKSKEDDLISFFTKNKERCCLSCNRLEMCRSWSFETYSQTCVLKAGYRSNPTVVPNYESGFKPSDLFTLSVTRGLEFINLNNSIYDFLLNYTIESGSDEREFYLLTKTQLEKNILEILTENENVTFIQQILVTNLFYNITSLLVDYDLNIDPRFNEKIADILFLMNDLFATPNRSDNELLRLKLPSENEDESNIIVRVPETTSQFKIIATNTSFFPIETTTPLTTTPINLDQYSKYLGCFNDKTTDRDLAYSELYPTAENSTHMTIASCIDLCRTLNQAYAGLQFGQECFCGNSYGKHGETDKKDCFITCAGDRDSTCGGFLKNAVYSVGLYYTTELKTSTEPIGTQEFSIASIFTSETSALPASSKISTSSTTSPIEFFSTSTIESTHKPTDVTTNDFFENITTSSTNESTNHGIETTFASSFSTLPDISSLFETTTEYTYFATSLETEYSTKTDPIFSTTSISPLYNTNTSTHPPDFSTFIPITAQNSTEQVATAQTNEAKEPLGTTTKSFVTSDRILSDSTSLIGLTGPTLLVSTSSGIISPRPILSNPSAFLITEIKVDKEIDVKSEEFRTKLTDGLKRAYTAAFRRTNSLYYSQESAAVSDMDIWVNLVNVTITGDTNSDKTKNILQLRYYIFSNNELVSSEYAADSINLLSDQEMARYLDYEIQNQGYVEIKPRENVQTDQKLWIIAAVLGPLLLFFILIWIILFVYYKCINPRPNNKTLDKNDTSEESKDGKNFSDESLINVNENVKQTSVMKSAKIEPLVESPGPNDDNFLINHATKDKKKKKDNLKLPDLNQNRIVPNPDLIKSEDENFSDYQVEDSIKQKTEAEKWRNKQRNREKNSLKTENETTRRKRPGKKISPTQSDNSDRLSPIGTAKKSDKKPETKSQVSILTNSSDILHNNLNNFDNPSVIVSEFSKPYQPHVPVKVHVNNKPTVEDTTRVYNPYPFQNEYEKYFKNGFLFEPVESTGEHQLSTVNANAKFTSDLISPYNRKDNSIHFKNYASNDKLLDYARESKVGFGKMNLAFKDDSESEFKNLNNLKDKTVTKGAEIYEDELDLINKYKKNSENNYSTYELVDSINQELKNLKSGYKPNGSNA